LDREIKTAFVEPAILDFVVQTFDPLACQGLAWVKPESLLSLLICKRLLFVESLSLADLLSEVFGVVLVEGRFGSRLVVCLGPVLLRIRGV
jgi:hypothetical protein